MMKIISLTVLAATLIVFTGCQNGDSSSMFQNNPERTGVYNSEAPSELTALAWKYRTDGEIFSSPVVHDGTVYFGSSDSCLYAVR